MGLLSEGTKKLLPKIILPIIAAALGITVGQLTSHIVDVPTRIKAIDSTLRKNNRRL